MTVYQEQLKELKSLLKTKVFSLYTAQDGLGGKKVQELESLFSEYLKVKHCILTNSATSALHIANISISAQGNSIIVPTLTFSATASSVLMAGGKVILADIQPDIYTLDPMEVKQKAHAVIPVHLHGHPADMGRIIPLSRMHKLWIIEDCAQALGAEYQGKKVGTLGDIGVFSFNQHKQINCGEGGMLVTNNDQIAETARLIRNHGETQSSILGYNFRMTELQACILIPQVKRLDSLINQTIELCETVNQELKGVEAIRLPVPYHDCKHVYYTYPLYCVSVDRDKLQSELRAKGIYFGNGGYKPLHLFPFYGGGEQPVAEDCYRNVAYTNIFRPPMKLKEAKRIARIIKDICQKN